MIRHANNTHFSAGYAEAETPKENQTMTMQEHENHPGIKEASEDVEFTGTWHMFDDHEETKSNVLNDALTDYFNYFRKRGISRETAATIVRGLCNGMIDSLE
jgi:hypothetical protein